jgi:acetyl-CoA/propionyl-CoA carboxylase biotin carboxyl carrier protein
MKVSRKRLFILPAEQGFRLHTRCIETSFAEPLAAAARSERPPMAAVQRLPLEVDGRRVSLGLPAGLLGRFVSASTGTGADDGFDAEPGAASTAADAGAVTAQIGRASCRERVS